MALFTDRQIAAMHRVEAISYLTMGGARGVGGPDWTYERPDGTTGTISAWVIEVKPDISATGGPVFIDDCEWQLVAYADTDVRVNDVLTNVDDASRRFQVMTVDQRQGYVIAVLEAT